MKKSMLFFMSLAFIISTSSCKDNNTSDKVLTQEITFKKDGTLRVYKKASDSLITTFNLEIAEGDYET